MKAKGRLQQGADADIVVFDPSTVRDVSTYEKPAQEATGMKYVLVSGALVERGRRLSWQADLCEHPIRLFMKLTLILASCCVGLSAQSWDTTGNALLNGNYYFREVFFTSSAAVSLYGNIVFSGSGTYTINAVGYQCGTSCGLGNYQTSGTYSIAASGFGFVSQNLLNGQITGAVGANGVFVGSATETGVSDFFVAAPVSGQNAGTLQGSYSASYLYPGAQVPYDALLQFTAGGNGTFGNVSVAAYSSATTPVNQTISGVKYIVSNNAFVVTFPTSSTNVVTGQEYLYSTPDGSFVFGGSPRDFDMLVGVRTGGPVSLSGTYFEAGLDVDNSAASSGNVFLDAFYGSFNATNSTIVGHQRLQDGSNPTYGYVYHDSYPLELISGYTDLLRSRQFIVGSGVRIGFGLGPYPAVTVAVQAPTVTRPSGMFLDPTGAVNTASYAPFTTGISSGELLTLNGSNLGPAATAYAFTTPLPTTLGGVQVLLNGHAAPILAAGATQIIIQVPFHLTTATALIQVSYKGTQSNTIAALVNTTTPGVFTIPNGGVSRASARHLNGTLVTTANPAKIGETISVYLSGLGDLTTNVADGGVGPTVTPAKPSSTIAFFVGGIAATPSFLALAPGLVGIYLVQLPIPAGVSSGDVYLDVASADAYSSQATIAVTSATTGVTSRKGPSREGRRGWQFPPMDPKF